MMRWITEALFTSITAAYSLVAGNNTVFIGTLNKKNDWRVLLLPDDERIKKRSLPCG